MIRYLIAALFCCCLGWADPSIISLIPRNIWQTYRTKTLPKPAFDAQQTWLSLNSDFSYFFTDDADIEEYIRKEWPAEYLEFYHALPIGAMKADLWRYLILTTNGGVYSDVDSICIQPIQNWLPDFRTTHSHVLIIDLDEDQSKFCQWTLVATPHHPAMEYVCRYILDAWKKRGGFPRNSDGSINVLDSTGPGIFSFAIKSYLNESTSRKARKMGKEYVKNKAYRAKLNSRGIFVAPKRFFQGGGSKNLFGSQCFGDGYVSWSTEAKKMAQAVKLQEDASSGR
ncbi:MAG: initiation-specific alpha-1,6-mannosyltransferase-like [Parachlamydiales bacterium]|nr:initiation-specific alpha-1,6-mannosyltransferase-like [Parachlamydiales bacterium]